MHNIRGGECHAYYCSSIRSLTIHLQPINISNTNRLYGPTNLVNPRFLANPSNSLAQLCHCIPRGAAPPRRLAQRDIKPLHLPEAIQSPRVRFPSPFLLSTILPSTTPAHLTVNPFCSPTPSPPIHLHTPNSHTSLHLRLHDPVAIATLATLLQGAQSVVDAFPRERKLRTRSFTATCNQVFD